MKYSKSLFLLSTLACLFSGFAYASSPAWSIKATRRQYNTINANLLKYSQIGRPLMGYSTEGAELKAYFAGAAPRKVVTEFFGCRHQIQEEYYFWGNRLFFVYQVRLEDTGLPARKILKRRENRFYFSNGSLMRWLRADKAMSVTSSEARQQERALLKDAREWLALAHKPK